MPHESFSTPKRQLFSGATATLPQSAGADADRTEALTAVLLIAHGSRRESANRDLEELAEQLRQRRLYRWIEVAYLELAQPSIPDGCRICVERGAKRVLMLPWFLSAGRHVNDDLERIRGEQSARYAGVEFRLRPPLGLHPLMVQIVIERLAEGAAARQANHGTR